MCSDVPDDLATLVYEYTAKKKVIIDCIETEIEQQVRAIDCAQKHPRGGNIGVVCPECVFTGARTKVYVECTYHTCGGVMKYHDAAGYHIHDPNESTANWKCSGGHAGTYRALDKCPVAGCDHSGHKILTTDPYEFTAAKKAREEAREAENKESVRSVAVNGGTVNDVAVNGGTVDTNIASPIVPPYTSIGYAISGPALSLHPVFLRPAPDTITLQVMFNGKTYSGVLYAEPEPSPASSHTE